MHFFWPLAIFLSYSMKNQAIVFPSVSQSQSFSHRFYSIEYHQQLEIHSFQNQNQMIGSATIKSFNISSWLRKQNLIFQHVQTLSYFYLSFWIGSSSQSYSLSFCSLQLMRIDDAYAYLFTWIIIQVQMWPPQVQGILALFSQYCSLIRVSRKLTKLYFLYLNSLFDFLSYPFRFNYFLLSHCVYSNHYNDSSLQRVDSIHISFAENDHLISDRANHIYNLKKPWGIFIIMCVLD